MKHEKVYLIALWVLVLAVAFPLEAAAITTISHTFNDTTWPAIRNSGFEADPALTQWYSPTGGWSRNSGIGLYDSKCAVGYSLEGSPVVLSQNLDQQTRDAVAGHSVEFTFWFKSGYSDDLSRAEVVYNGITVRGDWYYHSADSSTPWVQARVVVQSLPGTISSLTVNIVGQDGSGGDSKTKVYIDDAKLVIIDQTTVSVNQCDLGLVISIEQVQNQTGTPNRRNITVSVGFYAKTKNYNGVQYYIYSSKITAELYPLSGSQTQQYRTTGGQTYWGDLQVKAFGQGNDAGIYSNPVAEQQIMELLVDAAALAVRVAAGLAAAAAFGGHLPAGMLVSAVVGGVTQPMWSFVKDTLATYDPSAVNGDYRTLTKWNHHPPLYTPAFAKQGSFANYLSWTYPYPMVNNGGGGWYLKLTAVLEWGHAVPPQSYPYWGLAYDGSTSITTNIYCW